ncbi:MAG: type II secretion system protein [Candidatus Shapirobacteria bacterium]
MKNKKGFTLIEMLVVISIIAILTALISVSFSMAQKKARDSRRMQDMKSLQTAAEQYYSSNDSTYPLSLGLLSVDGLYIQSIPKDPKDGTDYSNDMSDTEYCVCALLDGASNANSSSGCKISDKPGDYFCVYHQQ